MFEFLARATLVRDVMKYQNIVRGGTAAAAHRRRNHADPAVVQTLRASKCAVTITIAAARS
jgi:hypothetical protein